MLASNRHHTRARRGIVLVLVLAMLGLLALIGVTFATFSGQARINARLYAQSVIRPQDDELMDFALQQLITDTADPRSAIRGHSIGRDMFGSDAFNNGYLAALPITGQALQISKIQRVTSFPNNQVYVLPSDTPPAAALYDVLTNIPIPANAPAMYGFDFTRWIMRISYVGGATATAGAPYNLSQYPVNQTCEILIDDFAANGTATQFSGQGFHAFRIAVDATVLNNPTLGWTVANNNATQQAISAALNASTSVTFALDGRWLHAFNGPGMGGNAAFGNFRFNGGILSKNPLVAFPGAPGAVGMDEDYDACDLENWFLAIQSADGQVVIPSFHRPGIIRYDPANGVNDWQRINLDNSANPSYFFPTSASRILRPCWADGHDQSTFPDLYPDSTTGKITYDVDNDGDGATDSVWVDLGYPARRDANGRLYKPLFAFMVIGLNGRIPLNTAGNLANGGSHAEHLGNSVSETDPQYGLQNAYIPYNAAAGTGDYDPFNSILNNQVPGANTFWNGPTSQYGGTTIATYNTQVDNAINAIPSSPDYGKYQSVDVRLTQLRHLLAGTRPQPSPLTTPNTAANGDTNVIYGTWSGSQAQAGARYFLPNGISDGADTPYYTDPATGFPLVQRTTPPVAGRWGEAPSIPGVPYNNPTGGAPTYLNLVQPNYSNPVRAGYSFDVADMVTNATYNNVPFPRDAADDNYNAFDVFPTRLTGEVNDVDFYDAAGALLLPVERMRRFVTPMDINGTGSVRQFSTGGGAGPGPDLGADNFGRVQFSSYFRPAGSPGVISVNYAYNSATQTATPVANAAANGAIVFPTGNPPAAGTDPFYVSGPNPGNTVFYNATGTAGAAGSGVTPYYPFYLVDRTSNPFHGFEFYKVPNFFQNPGDAYPTPGGSTNYNTQKDAGMPIDQNALTAASVQAQNGPAGSTVPTSVPFQYNSYDNSVNSGQRLDGVNEADEMNLYSQNPLLDSPYGPSDLEWLYRQQDVDGGSMTSRLSQLAPVSFTNTLDGQRRRRLYALDSWESNNFFWTNDNPGGAFPYNARFNAGQSPSFGQLSANLSTANVTAYVGTPSLAQRDKKINLNYPLPVSNDPNESVRQKWISETYQLLKLILPPDSVDTAEELAQLSQFVINIIDFRDPDATMTHWVNPDVVLTPGTLIAAGPPIQTTYPTLTLNIGGGNLDQYGMEYCPVAINEVLAYSFQSRDPNNTAANATMTNRFFIELVNTLTAAYNPFYDYKTGATLNYNTEPSALNNYYGNQASALGLGGFNYVPPTGALADPYAGGCWDLIFTTDDAWSRPDPYRGELVYNPNAIAAGTPNYYSLIPLNRDALTPAFNGTGGGTNALAPNGGDATLIPVNPNPPGGANTPLTPPTAIPTPANQPTGSQAASGTPATVPPIGYFYVIANPQTTNEFSPLSTSSTQYPTFVGAISPTTPGAGTITGPAVSQYLVTAYDPIPSVAGATPPSIYWHQGMLPGVQATTTGGTTTYTQPPNFAWDIPGLTPNLAGGVGTAKYYWVCLRRPANPFAPVSASNPMCVVDSMRFPFIDGSASTWTPPDPTNNRNYWLGSGPANNIYSAQRLQPYRGGHAVPMPNVTGTGTPPPDPRYGYTEQIGVPQYPSNYLTYGRANTTGGTTYPSTANISYHSLGQPNDTAENWDYLVFNDRDFTSVAELLLVPGCPPGLFTKQFVEIAPSQITAANIFSGATGVTALATPNLTTTTLVGAGGTPPTTVAPVPPSTTPPVLSTFKTATAPFYSVSAATTLPTPVNPNGYTPPATQPAVATLGTVSATQLATVMTPVQPRAYPYLVDKFFYTGASNFLYPPLVGPDTGGPPATTMETLTQGGAGATDPSSSNGRPVVGGPAADGWYKMFEFLEVPSQASGAIGPVAQGANFDWARQDSKPGLMNINLVIDEEAFFAIFGKQDTSYNQALLNGIELPPWPNNVIPYLQNPQGTLPLTNYNNGTVPIAPIPYGYSPIPLVVTALQNNGAPNFVYPVVNQGYLAPDPIQQAINAVNNPTVPAVGNRMKAAFAQFLWLRHGGSGYLFGFGNGMTGQNVSAATTTAVQPNNGAIPSERPFRSLSFPDIGYTIMRPAALPPSTVSNPQMIVPYAGNTPLLWPAVNAQTMIYTPPGTALGTAPWYWVNASAPGQVGTPVPNYYAPFVTSNATPAVYSGDPGVRNPFLWQGYSSSDLGTGTNAGYTSPYPVTGNNTVAAGMPVPVNLAFPSATVGTPTLATASLPPAIPAVRLFQAPDAYGAGAMMIYAYNGTSVLPPPVSNATDSGDPWINNQVPNQPYQAMPGANQYYYALNNGFPTLVWPWMSGTGAYSVGNEYLSGGASAFPPNPATGVLPLVSPPNAPTTQTKLTMGNTTYLGSNAAPAGGPGPPPPGVPGTAGPTQTDDRQHPYWRTEMLQRAMNLTTVRTHQYAVWITVGFFEVRRQGDIGMLGQGAPALAFDAMGPEVGALNGQNVRYRGFFLVDRLKLTGFDPGNVGAFHNAIVYRKVIQ
jgi:hypothetical protein